MNEEIKFRSATVSDAEQLVAIYAPYVEGTAVSFETSVPSVAEFAERVAKIVHPWVWLVAERDGKIIGYAYGHSHRERAAYRWSVETTIYIAKHAQRQGLGKLLYARLFETLIANGFCNAFAGITLPNDASIALHRSVGFQPIGVFPRVGRKYGQWRDVAWFSLQLKDSPENER